MRSDNVKAGTQQAPHRSLFNALGFTQEEMKKPMVGIVSSYNEIVPGHMNLDKIVDAVRLGVAEAGGVPVVFPAIAVCDGIAMGHIGMKYSLVTRDLIADSTECMALAHQFDALVMVPNCDKNVPGLLMAAARINVPTVFVSGGPMLAGHVKGEKRSLSSMFEAVGSHAAGMITDEELLEFEEKTCPTCGSCSGMYTANSMNCLTEALGLSLPGNGTIPATHANRRALMEQAGRRIVEMTREYYENGNENVLPRNIASRQAMLNAMTMDIAMGGSTNTVLHLLAVAAEAGTHFAMEDIDALSRHTPVLCKVAPNSKYHIDDVNRAGGGLTILRQLAGAGLVDTSVLRADGLTLGEAIERYAIGGKDFSDAAAGLWKSAPGHRRTTELGCQANTYPELDNDRATGCIRDTEHAYMADGGLAVLRGNLAPDGCVVKTAGVDASILTFSGPARVFRSQEEAMHGILDGTVREGDAVLITYEGPAGGPGMQEMLYPTSYLKSRHIDRHCALITDGRFSGGTSGLSIGHVSPEAAAGGPIGLVRDGDIIDIDIPARSISVRLSDEELAARRADEEKFGEAAFTPRGRDRHVSNALRIYSKFVSSADKGGVRTLK